MAVSYDSASQSALESTTNTQAHTCSGSNRVLYVLTAMAYQNGGNVTGVTYASEAMTLVDTWTVGTALGGVQARLWVKTDPEPGTNNIVWTASGTRGVACHAISFNGVNQTTPNGTIATDTNLDVVSSLSAGEMLLSFCVLEENAEPGGTSFTATGTNQTKRTDNASRSAYASGSTQTGSGSVTASYTFSSTYDAALTIAVPVAASAGISLNVRNSALLGDGTSSSQTLGLTTATVTSSSKIVAFCGVESTTTTFSSVTFDPGGSYETSLSAVGGNGSPPRVGGPDVLGQLWIADLPDSIPTGSYNLQITPNGIFGTGQLAAVAWVLNGAATGALEDVQYDSDATTTTTLSASLTNASTSYVAAGMVNGASATTNTWSGATEWWDAGSANASGSAADNGAGTSNVSLSCVGDSTANDKVMIAWAVAAASGGGSTGTGIWQMFPSAHGYLDDSTIVVGGAHVFKARALSSSYTIDWTDTVLADTTGALGTDQTVTLSLTSGLVSISSDVTWTDVDPNTVSYILIYDDTPTNPADPLLVIVELDAAQTVPSGVNLVLKSGDVYWR